MDIHFLFSTPVGCFGLFHTCSSCASASMTQPVDAHYDPAALLMYLQLEERGGLTSSEVNRSAFI